MRFFCVTDRPLPWPVPRFMEPVSTVPAGDGVLDLGEKYPELAGRGDSLGEYATLFGVRRLLQESWPDGAPPADEDMVGIAHYRRFAVTRPTGQPEQWFSVVPPEAFRALRDEVFLPPPATVLIPLPTNLGAPVLARYAAAHPVRDLLHFMALAVESGVIGNQAVSGSLGKPVMVQACAMGVYPAAWLVQVLQFLEQIVDRFESTVAVPRDADHRRVLRLCCERLHSLLLELLVAALPAEQIMAAPLLVVGENGTVEAAA